jgi:hypothetical protein
MAGGGGTPAAPQSTPEPTAPAASSTAAMTLKPGHSDIAFGKQTRLRGTVTSGGVPAAGKPVTLEASPFPYAAYAPVAQATTGPKGGYSFRVKPDRNTRYRAVAEGGTSNQRTVFVYLASKTRRKALGGGRFRDTLKVLGPLDVPYAGRRVYFYKLSHKGRRARRVAHARLLGLGHGRLMASAVLRLRGRRAHTLVCMPEPEPDAWGRPAPIDRACGAPRLVAQAQRPGVIE